MRVAIVTESFLPTVNGVSNSVARTTEQLERLGHTVLIVAPGPGPDRFSESAVERTPAIPLPGYRGVPIGLPGRLTRQVLSDFTPDVVHIAGPIVLGAWATSAARSLGVPAVAVYQTDFARFTRHYRLGALEPLAWRWLRRVHGQADLTLAPSQSAAWDLRRNGVPRVRIWGRGVDSTTFHPSNADGRLRGSLAPRGELIVGYVGRLAPEKDVGLLRAIHGMPGVRLLVVGDGPDRLALKRHLPDALFFGHQSGQELSRLFASLDVFVHTGTNETFCQTIQEALASGVPVVAPAIGGPRDLVRHNRNGLLYRPGDGRALRRAVARLRGDRSLAVQMGGTARHGVSHRGWAFVTDQLVAHYRDVCGPVHRSEPTASTMVPVAAGV